MSGKFSVQLENGLYFGSFDEAEKCVFGAPNVEEAFLFDTIEDALVVRAGLRLRGFETVPCDGTGTSISQDDLEKAERNVADEVFMLVGGQPESLESNFSRMEQIADRLEFLQKSIRDFVRGRKLCL
ncbi:MAG: hypothetical protein ACYDCM_07265 [Candidatus Acidiferrales bacterium]